MFERKYKYLLLLLVWTSPIHAQEWQIVRNDSVRIFYFPENRMLANKIFGQSNGNLRELSGTLGLPFSGEVNIFLAKDEQSWRRLTENRIPEWSQAVTKSESGVVYLKTQAQNGKNLQIVLRHELVHVLVGKNFASEEIPRWFEEGIAMLFSGEDFADYTAVLSRANLTNSLLSFTEIENVLQFQRSKANLAYAQSYFAVKMIVDALGWNGVRQIMQLIRQNRNMENAFQTVLNMNIEQLQWRMFKEIEQKYKWNFLYQSDVFFWVILPFLAVLVFIVIRIRNYRTYKRWEEEELESTISDYEQD